MENSVTPALNPAPDAPLSRPDRVALFEEQRLSNSSSPAPPNNEPVPDSSPAAVLNVEQLTELTGDDIFRMKELRNSESVSASEAAELSHSVADGVGNEEFEQPDQPSRSNPAFDPDATRNRTSELNEEDIFRMKSLSLSRSNALSEFAAQSAVSQVDSTSNYEEGVGNEEDEQEESSPAPESEPNSPPANLTFSGQFVFGRKRNSKPKLNTATSVELEFPFEPLGRPPPGVDQADYLKFFKQSKLFLVGTAHFSPESQIDVTKAINEVQPDVVMVELCAARVSILSLDEETLLREAKSLNRQKVMNIIKENGVVQGLLQVLLLSASAHITQELGMAPGGEFRAAHKASFRIPGCKLILGDRPIQITLQRALNSLGFFQKLRLLYHIIVSNRTSVTQEDVEKCKDKDLLESLLKEMAGEFPQISRIFVDERDKYMAYVLQTLMQSNTNAKIAAWKNCKNNAEYQPLNIVAVVGIGHMKGMTQHWNSHINNLELLEVPPPSRASRFIGFVVKVAIVSSVGYLTYRVGRGLYLKVTPKVGQLFR